MKARKIFASACIMLAMCLAVPATASALSPAVGRKAVRCDSVEISVTVSVAGRDGARYDAGDLVLISASVTNVSEKPVTGDVKIMCPAFEDHGLIAVPAFPESDGYYEIGTLEPGQSVELAVAMRAPEDPGCKDWLASAYFIESGTRAVASGFASGQFGEPVLKAERKSIRHDGVIKIWNEGKGSASKIKFWFTVKPEQAGKKGLPEDAKELDGKVEIELGGLVPGGKIEKDVSGLLHQRMDPDGPYGFTADGGDMPEGCWE